jgi:hypothetical protein
MLPELNPEAWPALPSVLPTAEFSNNTLSNFDQKEKPPNQIRTTLWNLLLRTSQPASEEYLYGDREYQHTMRRDVFSHNIPPTKQSYPSNASAKKIEGELDNTPMLNILY